MTAWMRERDQFIARVRAEGRRAVELIRQCRGADAVLLADDIAGCQATLFHPRDLETLCRDTYVEAAAQIRRQEAAAWFHSCGNFLPMLPMLLEAGFQGLAGCQLECLELEKLWEQGPDLTVMSGIPPAEVDAGGPVSGPPQGLAGKIFRPGEKSAGWS